MLAVFLSPPSSLHPSFFKIIVEQIRAGERNSLPHHAFLKKEKKKNSHTIHFVLAHLRSFTSNNRWTKLDENVFERHLLILPENRVSLGSSLKSRGLLGPDISRRWQLHGWHGRFLPENRRSSRTNGILTNDRPTGEEAKSIDRSIALPPFLLSPLFRFRGRPFAAINWILLYRESISSSLRPGWREVGVNLSVAFNLWLDRNVTYYIFLSSHGVDKNSCNIDRINIALHVRLTKFNFSKKKRKKEKNLSKKSELLKSIIELSLSLSLVQIFTIENSYTRVQI